MNKGAIAKVVAMDKWPIVWALLFFGIFFLLMGMIGKAEFILGIVILIIGVILMSVEKVVRMNAKSK